MKSNYYNLSNILKYKADYNVIIGERSNGKTYALLEKAVKDFCDGMERNQIIQTAYIRRWNDDIIGKRIENLFNSIVSNGLISKYSKNKYDRVIFVKGCFYMAREATDDEIKATRYRKSVVADKTPFCYVFSLSTNEHIKSLSYPYIKNIIFDEFLTRMMYLPNEFVVFMNLLSTLIRDRDNIQIFMLGNTVNKESIYFSEMGISNIDKQKQGTIDLYEFGNDLLIAVEYCDNVNKSKKSNKYFAFDNPRLQMITSGKWELAIYNHLPIGYKIEKKDIAFTFTFSHNNKLATGNVIIKDNDYFLFIHRKTTPYKDGLIYGDIDSVDYLHKSDFITCKDKISVKILQLFKMRKVYYDSNETGEFIRNYLISLKNQI